MSRESKKARAEIQGREWVEIEVFINASQIIEEAKCSVWGCHDLISAAQAACTKIAKKKLSEIQWEGTEHWNLLIKEIFLKLNSQFQLPIADQELCHCRMIPTAKVDAAIVLGAQTPEKVKAWTTASSGCGTCRPNVEKLISYRLGKAS